MGYRSDLAAAHERIATLERQVASLRRSGICWIERILMLMFVVTVGLVGLLSWWIALSIAAD